MTDKKNKMATDAMVIFLNVLPKEVSENIFDENGILQTCNFHFEKTIETDNMQEDIDITALKLSDKFSHSYIRFIFVGLNNRIDYFYTDEGKRFYNRISELSTINNSIFSVSFIECSVRDYLSNLEIDPNIHYIFASNKKFEHEYDYANYLSLPMEGNIFYAWGIENIQDVLNSKCFYNIYGNEKNEECFDCFGNTRSFNINSVKNVIKRASIQCKFLKNARILDISEFISAGIPPYVLNIECEIFSAGIIIYYGLFLPKKFTSSGEEIKQNTPQIEFCENSSYRYQLLDTMLRVLFKRAIDFGHNYSVYQNAWHSFNLDTICDVLE